MPTYGASTDAGTFWTPSRSYTTSANMTSAGNITVAPATGQKIVVDDLLISTDTAMNVVIQEETSGTVLAKFFLPANSVIQVTPRDGMKADTADKHLQAVASVSGNIAITTWGHSES